MWKISSDHYSESICFCYVYLIWITRSVPTFQPSLSLPPNGIGAIAVLPKKDIFYYSHDGVGIGWDTCPGGPEVYQYAAGEATRMRMKLPTSTQERLAQYGCDFLFDFRYEFIVAIRHLITQTFAIERKETMGNVTSS